MSKIIKTLITVILIAANLCISAFAYQYNFSSGADTLNIFDKTTDKDDFYDDTNVRRDKEVAYFPPAYGIFSGNIDTDRTNPYYSANNYTPSSSASVSATSNVTFGSSRSVDYSGFLPSTSVFGDTPAQTLPMYYKDGSIGTLEFPRFGKTIKVYEGETLDNMRLGAAHFSSTSCWDGNVCVAAHNRGVPNNFIFLKDMNIGDTVIYTTPYGARTYEVILKTQIPETDTSGLAWSAANILSLYTCVQNVAGVRIYVVCREVT